MCKPIIFPSECPFCQKWEIWGAAIGTQICRVSGVVGGGVHRKTGCTLEGPCNISRFTYAAGYVRGNGCNRFTCPTPAATNHRGCDIRMVGGVIVWGKSSCLGCQLPVYVWVWVFCGHGRDIVVGQYVLQLVLCRDRWAVLHGHLPCVRYCSSAPRRVVKLPKHVPTQSILKHPRGCQGCQFGHLRFLKTAPGREGIRSWAMGVFAMLPVQITKCCV